MAPRPYSTRPQCSWSAALGLHTQFIGEVKDVKIDEACLDKDGHIDVGKLDPLAFAPETGAYFALGGLVGRAYSLGKTFVAEGSS